MKKVLSMFLAMVLTIGMTTMAFAAVGPEGKSYTLGTSARVNNATKGTLLSEVETLNPKDIIYIPVLDANGQVARKGILSSDKITPSLKVTKGSNLLEKPVFEVVGNAVYMKVEVKSPYVSTKSTDLVFTAALAHKNKADKEDVVYFDGKVENIKNEDLIDNAGYVYDVVDSSVFEVDSNFSGKVSFDFGDGIEFNDVRVFSKQKFYLNLSRTTIPAISEKYGDKADLAFYTFNGGMNSFSSTGTLSIPAEKDTYAYKVENGNLVAINYEYNTNKGTVEIQTRKLESYVLSDTKLDISFVAEEAEAAPSENAGTSTGGSNTNDNPGTGASSMLNVAVVAGVLSLAVAVSASLKK